MPLAPGRFSTRNTWWNTAFSLSLNMRARMSAPPPATGITNFTGFDGHGSCARAAGASSSAKTMTAMRLLILSMQALLSSSDGCALARFDAHPVDDSAIAKRAMALVQVPRHRRPSIQADVQAFVDAPHDRWRQRRPAAAGDAVEHDPAAPGTAAERLVFEQRLVLRRLDRHRGQRRGLAESVVRAAHGAALHVNHDSRDLLAERPKHAL